MGSWWPFCSELVTVVAVNSVNKGYSNGIVKLNCWLSLSLV